MDREGKLLRAGRLYGWPTLSLSAAFEWAQQSLPDRAAVVALPDDALSDVDNAIARLTQVVLALYPAWLPEAKGINGPAGSGHDAVVGIARTAARRSDLYGPVLEYLALAALHGELTARTPGVPHELMARECGKLIRAAYAKPDLTLVLEAPRERGITIHTAEFTALWLAQHVTACVWIAGPLAELMPRVSAMNVSEVLASNSQDGSSAEILEPPPWASALQGRPNPFSHIEQRLEAHLGTLVWSEGRAWNVSWQGSSTENPIIVDLMWADERLIVELDGPEHRGAVKFAGDRRRDRLLQIAGFAVLRFTNSEIETDIGVVASHIERFLTQRRLAPTL